MGKRFTSSEKWEDRWYRLLKPKMKNFWDYICTRCDNAGVWKPEWDMASFFIGEEVTPEEALQLLNDGKVRIHVLNNGYWQILGWIAYQAGSSLNDKIGAHRSIIAQINKYNAFGFNKDGLSLDYSDRVSHTLIDKKETRKRLEREKDKDGGVGEGLQSLIEQGGGKVEPITADSLAVEVVTFKAMGWNSQKIKEHFLMRAVPEAEIDVAMGKVF